MASPEGTPPPRRNAEQERLEREARESAAAMQQAVQKANQVAASPNEQSSGQPQSADQPQQDSSATERVSEDDPRVLKARELFTVSGYTNVKLQGADEGGALEFLASRYGNEEKITYYPSSDPTDLGTITIGSARQGDDSSETVARPDADSDDDDQGVVQSPKAQLDKESLNDERSRLIRKLNEKQVTDDDYKNFVRRLNRTKSDQIAEVESQINALPQKNQGAPSSALVPVDIGSAKILQSNDGVYKSIKRNRAEVDIVPGVPYRSTVNGEKGRIVFSPDRKSYQFTPEDARQPRQVEPNPRPAPRGPAAAPATPAAMPAAPAATVASAPTGAAAIAGAALRPSWVSKQFVGSKIDKWYKWFSPSGISDKLNMRKALKSETNLRRKHGEGWRETEDGKKLVSWMHAAFPGLYGSSAPAATVDASKMTRDQMRSYLKEEPRATERAMRDLKSGIIAEGEQLGHAQRLMRISEDIKKRFPLWKRVAIGAGLVGAGALGAAFSPALASITALSALAWRAGSSIAAGVTTTAAAYSYLEKRNSKHPMVYSVLAGTLAGATAFNSTYIFEKLSELVQGKIQWNPFASATPIPFMSDPVPPPGLAIPDAPSVGGLPLELQPRTIVPGVEGMQEPHINSPHPIPDAPAGPPGGFNLPPVPPITDLPTDLQPQLPTVPSDPVAAEAPAPTPESTPVMPTPTPMPSNLIDITPENVGMLRNGLDSLVNAKFTGVIDAYGFTPDEMHQFKDALRRTLVKFPDLAQQLTGSGVNPITAQGNIIFQDGGRIDLSVFGNQKFLDVFKEQVTARERKYLMPKLNSMGGVDALVDMLKSRYVR